MKGKSYKGNYLLPKRYFDASKIKDQDLENKKFTVT